MKIGLAGYKGRIGQLLVAELLSDRWPDLTLSAGLSRTEKSNDFPVFTSAEDLFAASDCIIDFTHPDATAYHADIAASTGKPLVIGTTGLSDAQEQILRTASQKTAILYAANMSVGVNLLLSLVEKAAASLPSLWDIEIAETHHKHKIDAPSGTALALGKAAQKGRGGGAFVTDRAGKRQEGDIGYAVSRGGDVVGEHTVTFYGMGERIELGHKATDRALFARGALQGAQWLATQPPGLYSMRDVLGL